MTTINELMQDRMKQLRDENTSIQQRKRQTAEERERAAVDTFTGHFKNFAEKAGKDISEDAARREAVKLAERYDRQKSE